MDFQGFSGSFIDSRHLSQALSSPSRPELDHPLAHQEGPSAHAEVPPHVDDLTLLRVD